MPNQPTKPNSKEEGVLINGFLVHPDDPFTVQQAAQVLNRSKVTVYRMIADGDLSPIMQRGERGKLTIWGRAIITASGIDA